MKKEEILNASRKEHQNKDLAEMEVLYLAGSHASRVGALVCCLLSLLSSMLAHTMIYSPWVIYFCILATQWLVRFIPLNLFAGTRNSVIIQRHLLTILRGILHGILRGCQTDLLFSVSADLFPIWREAHHIIHSDLG